MFLIECVGFFFMVELKFNLKIQVNFVHHEFEQSMPEAFL